MISATFRAYIFVGCKPCANDTINNRSIEAEQLRRLYQRTGCPLHSAYALPQLRIFYKQQENKKTATPVHKWQTIASLVLSRWTGRKELPISFSEASWTGLLNIHTCEWDKEILQYLPKPCQEALPNLKDCTDSSAVLGGIREYNVSVDKGGVKHKNPYWARWPELRGLSGVEDDGAFACCRLFLGIGDGASANLGSKCTSPSRVAVTIGTSAAARVCLLFPSTTSSSSPTSPRDDLRDGEVSIPPGLWCYRITKDFALVGGALTDGGSVIDWSRNLLNLKGEAEFASCMEEVGRLVQQERWQKRQQKTHDEDNDDCADDSTIETFVPYLSGERSTGFRVGATAVMSGLTRNTTPARFLKSCMEGVTLRLNAIVKLINSTISLDPRFSPTSGVKEKPILVASGSALEKNAIWRQMIADCSEMEVVTDSDMNECTCRGAARLIAAAVCMEYYPGIDGDKGIGFLLKEENLTPIDVCTPSPNTKHHWTVEAHAQNELIDAVCTTWLSRGETYKQYPFVAKK